MKHIDKNSSKHFGVCFIISLCCGLVGGCIAILSGTIRSPTGIGAGGIYSLMLSDAV